MTLLSMLQAAIRGDDGTDSTEADDTAARARCRSCGRYYLAAGTTCPHCGSGNRLLGGAPGRRHDRH